jgi:hypothetical protein
MKEARTLDRRAFTVESALAILSGVLITITGCDDNNDKNNPSTPSPVVSGDVSGVVSNNHGHVATITRAQLTTGNALNLDIQGTASHTHTVQLTAAEIMQIGGGQRVAKDSTTDSGHNHTVTFN